MLNKMRKAEFCDSCISTLLRFSENVIGYKNPGEILNGLADLLKESGFADKCVLMAEDVLNAGSRTIASFGFASAELKIAIRYMEDQAREEALGLKENPVVVTRDRQGMNALWSRIQDESGFRILVLSIRSDKLSQFTESDVSYMGVLVNTLRISLGRTDFQRADSLCQERILEAKKQWEFSMDNMQELVCILDEQGRVVRANKTLERWRRGDVKSIKGSTVHQMLHPDCKNEHCEFNLAWEDLWNRSEHSHYEMQELYDQDQDYNIRLCIRRGEGEAGQHLVALVVEDISGSNWEAQLLEAYTEELYKHIHNQSSQIAHVNAALLDEVHDHDHDKKSLRKSQAKLKTLSAKLLTAHEEERKRIAAELHDGIGQSISAIKFGLESFMAAGANGVEVLCDKNQLGITIGRLQAAVEEVRRISMGLRPSMLDDLGLLPTLEWFFREFRGTFDSMTLEVVLDFAEQEMSSVQKLMIFRIIQEALNNAAKYSQADTAKVELRTENDQLILLIEDNGIGFGSDNKRVGQGFGLGSMKERAVMSEGVLTIDSTIGKGTAIRAVWT